MRLRFAWLLFLPITFINAQQFGGHPPATKWEQINTDTARIIFLKGLDSPAQRVAKIVHKLADLGSLNKPQFRKVDIVLQNHTTISNGYVQLGPFRSEFYLTPSPNNFELGSIYWPEALALHEYRHVQQFNRMNVGLSRVMYRLFGEEGLALAVSAAVPDWFFEGDAVHAETVYSRQGRGRIPFFTNQYKSILMEDLGYSWMKLRNGSLKDFIPSHYQLGFLLVNYGVYKYGDEFWNKVTRDAAAYKGVFYPMQKAIERHSSVSYKKFRIDAFDYFKETIGQVKEEGYKDSYVSETYPYLQGDSLIILNSSYRRISSFQVNGKKVQKKRISLDDHYSYRAGKFIYATYSSHPRWGWRDYSNLVITDARTGISKRVGKRSKYFSPDLSPAGNRIATVEFDEKGKSKLLILDENGFKLQSIQSSEIYLFTDPKFIDEDRVVTAVRLNDNRMALAIAHIPTASVERLTVPTHAVVGNPFPHNDTVYFTASYTGNDEIYAISIPNKKMFQLTEGELGNYQVSADKGQVAYSGFTAFGNKVRIIDKQKMLWKEVNTEAFTVEPPVTVAGQAGVAGNLHDSSQRRNFAITNYSKSTGLFNFHSWRPYFEDPIFTFSIYGENVLNTFQSEIYYLHNLNENTNAAGFNLAYGGLFPVLSFGSEFTFGLSDTLNGLKREWHHLDSRIGFNIPLNLTGGYFFRYLNFGSTYVFRNEFNTGKNKSQFAETNWTYLSHFISYSQTSQRARQHIYPRYGFNMLARHRHPLTGFDGYQFSGSTNLYLPGLMSVHNLIFSGSFQQRDTLRALFSTAFSDARGYSDYYRTTAGSRMWKIGANYHLPLWLPDWGFANIVYFQRVRANLFYDHQQVYSNNKLATLELRSAGIELFTDTKWWNQHPLSFGIRVVRLLDDDVLVGRAKGSHVVEFILPVSIIPR